MLRFSQEMLDRMEQERCADFHSRLRLWLSKRNVGWTDLSPSEQDAFLAENDRRGRQYEVNAEKTRGFLALSLIHI